MIDQIDGLHEIPTINGRKLALIQADEDAFIDKALTRWADRAFRDIGPHWWDSLPITA